MKLGLLLALFTVATTLACSDPSLQVTFAVSEAYQSDVETVSMAVIVPPEGAPFTCEDLAFGLVESEQIDANTVEEVRVQRGRSTKLNGIPREGLCPIVRLL